MSRSTITAPRSRIGAGASLGEYLEEEFGAPTIRVHVSESVDDQRIHAAIACDRTRGRLVIGDLGEIVHESGGECATNAEALLGDADGHIHGIGRGEHITMFCTCDESADTAATTVPRRAAAVRLGEARRGFLESEADLADLDLPVRRAEA